MTTWILLRGLTREAGHWGRFPDQLRSALGDASIVTIDLPGAGHLHNMRSPSRIEEVAIECREQALARGLQPPFNLVALSLGAMVAVAWANAHADEVAAAVLINTSMGSHCPPWRRLRPGAYPALFRLLLPATDSARETTIYRLTSHRPADEDAIVSEWAALRKRHPVTVVNALRQLWAAARYRPFSPPEHTRILVLSSGRDRLVDPECSRRLASEWHADRAEHPDAGHDLPLDDGAWVAARIAEWR